MTHACICSCAGQFESYISGRITLKAGFFMSGSFDFQVECDLPIVSGEQSVTVLPAKQEFYTMTLSPVRRGIFKGVLAFVAGKNPLV